VLAAASPDATAAAAFINIFNITAYLYSNSNIDMQAQMIDRRCSRPRF
jgi:hypothetical protein